MDQTIPAFSASVTLVGAGPGDPELLTLKAVKAIASATVLLVDDLVSDAVIALASPAARVVHVGKRGGCRSTPQAFICKMMIHEALSGEMVVRLKGGDPLIFGRGGEEMAVLQAAGVSVQLINGITAGLAAANSAGVALTHRDHAHGVMFVTGHAQADSPGPDWPALAACARSSRLTLVIYMGVRGALDIQTGLLQGLPHDTSVLVVQSASLPQQRQVLTTLAELHDTLLAEQLGSPAVIIVGDVTEAAALAASPGACLHSSNTRAA